MSEEQFQQYCWDRLSSLQKSAELYRTQKAKDEEELKAKGAEVDALFAVAGAKAKHIKDFKTFKEWKRRFWEPAIIADYEAEGRMLPWRYRQSQVETKEVSG